MWKSSRIISFVPPYVVLAKPPKPIIFYPQNPSVHGFFMACTSIFHGKNLEKPWKNLEKPGKNLEKPWKNLEKPWKNIEKPWKNPTFPTFPWPAPAPLWPPPFAACPETAPPSRGGNARPRGRSPRGPGGPPSEKCWVKNQGKMVGFNRF